ncbi:SDR family NAD(P)-dependent oxidoreductase [Streptomyces sp. NPDC007084]|uniref:SDR family NAD(P)-dependent oxidoreductase n=1 Tax=Streptomyces sp. NPDC007084 TaxID=3154313 RepID=UPI0034513C67
MNDSTHSTGNPDSAVNTGNPDSAVNTGTNTGTNVGTAADDSTAPEPSSTAAAGSAAPGTAAAGTAAPRGDGASPRLTVLITGAGSGFGALSARALARAGHTVYAAMRDTGGRNASRVDEARAYAAEHGVDLRTVELDVLSQESADAAVATVLDQAGRLDVVAHNAGHMVTGPTEAFTPEEIAAVYDTNVLGTQRVNRAALPHLRARGEGLLLWVGSSSSRGGTPPYLAPYFAAKAAMDALAVSYAAELARFGVETSIVVPGAFTSGTNHFASGGHPAETAVLPAYEERYGALMEQVGARLAALAPAGADASLVADAIVDIVGTPWGRRPFRVHVDPADDGSAEVSEVADRVRARFLARIGLADVLTPHRAAA